jgi:hypothetical protein
VVEAPRVWFEKRLPDGKHIAAPMPADTPEEFRDRVISFLNFFDELRRHVPAGCKESIQEKGTPSKSPRNPGTTSSERTVRCKRSGIGFTVHV